MESLWAPVGQTFQQFEVADALLQVASHRPLHHLFGTCILGGHRVVTSLHLELLQFLILFVDFVEAVGRVGHDHIDKPLENVCFTDVLECFLVD